MKRYLSVVIAFSLFISVMCGCQKVPEQNAVISKNDNVFQEKINNAISSEKKPAATEVPLKWRDEFSSTDGSVTFHIDIEKGVIEDSKKVIEVAPHFLTSDDIRRVAESLLGNVNFYERRPSDNPQYSKSQYLQMINRLAAYANEKSLTELMGESGAATYLEYIQDFIDIWNNKLESAPENDPRILTDWSLKKERHYNNSDVEIANHLAEDEGDVLYVNAEKNGIEYNLSVITKQNTEYKINRLNLNLTEGLNLYPVDMAIYRSMLCRTEPPTQEQIDAASNKAQEMLDKMELGSWSIANAKVESKQIGDTEEYVIQVVAAPVICGTIATLGQHMGNYQDAYVATYGMTYAEFLFSANGDLVYFNLDSPIDIIETRNENVETFSADELIARVKQHMSLSDSDAYGLPEESRIPLEDTKGERILCNVTLSEAEYGMGRVPIANTDDHYYYIPVLILKGDVEYIGEKSGQCYYANHRIVSEEAPALVWINAVDGSIIS